MATASEMFMDLQQRRDAAIQKYVYFLLATAAAAIAFSMQRVYGQAVSLSQIPLAVAIGWWAYSFWCGCLLIKSNDNLWVVELIYLDSIIKHGIASTDVVAARSERNAELGGSRKKYWDRQFFSLLCGGIMFAAWQGGEMILAGTAAEVRPARNLTSAHFNDIQLLRLQSNSGPQRSNVQTVISVLTIATSIGVSVGAVIATHRFTKRREEISFRRQKIEEMFKVGRALIKEYTLQAIAFLKVFEGKQTAGTAHKELSEKLEEQYKNAPDTPSMRADMLVGLYFPTVEPWLRSLELLGDQLEESVRSHPNESENAGQLSRDESAIQYTREAIVEYGAMRLTLLQLLNDELDKLK